MNVGRFFCFLDGDYTFYAINGFHFSEFLSGVIQILADPEIGLLLSKDIAVRWNFSVNTQALLETQTRKPHTLVGQSFIVQIREAIPFLPSPSVLAAVPIQELR